jgi:predicted nucleotidyltransferase
MPVRSLNSPVLKWPDARTVDQAVRDWAAAMVAVRPEAIRIGYFGSYARGDWGVGSDLDLLVIVEHASEPFERRRIRWDATELPVPADVLVYTAPEWETLGAQSPFVARARREAVWVYERP